MSELAYGVLVIGGGPAGVAAAATAAERVGSVGLLDDNPSLGGQIWRQGTSRPPRPLRKWLRALERGNVKIHPGCTVIDAPSPGRIVAVDPDGPLTLTYERLVLATGALERLLPFPGWTLPGVVGAGGLQALIKGGLDVRGARVVVAGSGPLLPAVADLVRRRGGKVVAVAEQADRGRLAGFAAAVAGRPSKALQALGLAPTLLGAPYRFGTWPVRAEGTEAVERVVLQRADGSREALECDLLACGFGLRPNVGIAAYLGCLLVDGKVAVDERRQTSVDGVYCAGEVTGIGGVDLAVLEGRIAGRSAAGLRAPTHALRRRLRRELRFVGLLERTFALRPELKELPEPETVVCRCEDVPWERIRPYDEPRDCKLKTRCGMGACQGRVCGGALEFLKGFRPERPRPPFFPVTLSTLAPPGAVKEKP